mgnify:FL=1
MNYPIKNFSWGSVSQMFGVNHDLYFDNFGIPGHNGIDYVDLYGTPILAAHDGQVTLISRDDPTRKNGNGIYIQGYDRENYIDTAYWHLSEITVTAGQKVKAGDVIGKMGNSGFVRPLPTPDNPQAGTHLHFGVRRIKILIPGVDTQIIPTDYKGFCDPTPFLYKGEKLPIRFNRDLFMGLGGDDVSHLQTCLKLEGFAKDYEPIGYFGNKTRRDVSLFQTKYGINPILGYCGTKTRKLLNEKYT